MCCKNVVRCVYIICMCVCFCSVCSCFYLFFPVWHSCMFAVGIFVWEFAIYFVQSYILRLKNCVLSKMESKNKYSTGNKTAFASASGKCVKMLHGYLLMSRSDCIYLLRERASVCLCVVVYLCILFTFA